MSVWNYFYTPLDGIRGTIREKCVTQEHNTIYPDRDRTQPSPSEIQRIYHYATADLSSLTIFSSISRSHNKTEKSHDKQSRAVRIQFLV